MSKQTAISKIQDAITDEIFNALGIARRGLLRRMFGWMFNLPTRRFARIMFEADIEVGKFGAPGGCRRVLEGLSVCATVRGVENIPSDKPAIILSNHPGAYDSVALGSQVAREDLKIIVMDTRFYHTLPNIDTALIYVDADSTMNMPVLRQAIAHLKKGGIILQFGSGLIEPDPSIRPVGDEVFANWSNSLEVMLRKVPETEVVPAIASGVLLERFASHPFTKLHKDEMDKRRLAEFMQIIQQLIWPKSVKAKPRISFGKTMTLNLLERQKAGRRLMDVVIGNVREVLNEHQIWVSSLEENNAG